MIRSRPMPPAPISPDRSALLGLSAVGALLGALAASTCCLLPLALFSVGVGGAWLGNLTALAPYQPLFVAVALGCLGSGFWLLRRESSRSCSDGSVCARPLPRRLTRLGLLTATVLVAAALVFPALAPLLLGLRP
jgi:mercuric ion transport protein